MRKSKNLRLFLLFLIITTILPVSTAQKSSAACNGTNFAVSSNASWTGMNGGQISGFDGELCSSASNNSYLALRTTSGIWSGSLTYAACSNVKGQADYAASSTLPGQGSSGMRALGTSYIAVRMCGGKLNITIFPSITGASGSVEIKLVLISGSGTPSDSNMFTNNTFSNSGLSVTASPISVVTYIVTYNGNGSTSGTVPSSQTKTNGMTLPLVNTQGSLLKTNYTFTGWNTLANGLGTSYAVGASYTADAAATLWAQWSVSTLTITYNSQGGSSISNGSTTPGGSIASSPGIPSRAGYIFDGWFVASSGGSAIIFPYTHGQATNFSLYAQWSVNAPSATATANTLGSISVSWTASADAVSYRLKLYSASNVLLSTVSSLSDPTYTFSNSAGLSISDGTIYKVSINVVDAIISNNYVNESILVSVTSNIRITFSASGASGSAPTSPTTVAYGQTFTTPSNTYSVPTGYTFSGWNDGSTTYAAGVTYPSTGSVSGNVTLSAVWTGITSAISIATVTGGSGTASPTSVTYPATTSLTATAATGYTFTSWSCTNGTLANSASASTTLSNITAASTCTPTFTINTFTITVTQGSNGTISPSTTTVNYGSNQAFTITAATGYSITTLTIDGVSNPTAASAGSYTFSNIVVIHSITASFSANTYTITYNNGANGAGGPLTQSFTFGSNPNLKNATAAITRAGYSISGWTTTDGTSQSHALSASYTNASNLTLYPVWSANSLVITFNSQTGSTITAASTTTGGSVADPGVPTLSRYTFRGWFAAASGGARITFPYIHGQTADFTLYAQWSPNNQSALTLTSVNGVAGTALLLTSTGGSGGGQITFTVSGVGCTIAIDPVVALSASAAGVCIVTVSKAADATYLIASSAPTAVTFLAYTITSGSGTTCPNNATIGSTISINSCQSVTAPTLVAPKITSLSASSGSVGATITITGTTLSGVTVLKFGGVIATISSNTETTVVVNVPAGAISGRVVLSTPGGTSIGPTFTVTN